MVVKVQFAFIALLQKRLQKQTTATLTVRVKSGPHVPMERQEESSHVRMGFTEAKPEISLFWR